MRDESGFTLIELMIVLAIIAVIAAVAIPNLLSARLQANETAAIATLRNIASAQTQFQTAGRADVDGDGIGEFGTFLELSGAADVRNDPALGPLVPPVLSAPFRFLDGGGLVSHSGYFFLLCLPDAARHGQNIDADPGARMGLIDANNAETFWCCYAWPTHHGLSGNRTFMVNQACDIITTEDSAYTGLLPDFDPAAAFLTAESRAIDGTPALGAVGFDGNTWVQVN